MDKVELNNQLIYMSSKSDNVLEQVRELIETIDEINKEFTYDDLDKNQKREIQDTFYNLVLIAKIIEAYAKKGEK